MSQRQPDHPPEPTGGGDRPPRPGSVDRGGRAGTEPVNARSPVGLRLLLSAVYVPVFTAAAVLFAVWSVRSGPHDSPGTTVLDAIAGGCAALALVAALDLVVLLRRRGRVRG